MFLWFRQNPHRFAVEYTAISNLKEGSEWLKGVSWKADEHTLAVEAVIAAHDYDYPIRMTYPVFFPETPPIVRPQDPDARWTSHAYKNGVLCLEWGPDTWHSGLTGADMLESAYQLLLYENPLGSEQPIVAPSRHYLTAGQQLRNKLGRLYISDTLLSWLRSRPVGMTGTIQFSSQLQDAFTVFVYAVQVAAESREDTTIPSAVKSSGKQGTFFVANLETSLVEILTTVEQLREVLAVSGIVWPLEDGEEADNYILLVDAAGTPHLFIVLNDGKLFKTVRVEWNFQEENGRLPGEVEALAGKRVGIVGMGSAGSRIALSLARTHVSSFLLVDHDVFLPENICRHILDWRDVGQHKADAVKTRLSYLYPDVAVDVSHIHLTGQESNAVLNRVLGDLAKCDLLIDATASSSVFYLLAAIAKHEHIPLVWMEVYAGGIGGMVARCRPGQDPPARTMRNAYESLLVELPLLDYPVVADYATEGDDNEIVVATDADVAVIAAHATQLALDALVNRMPSRFPHSMYLIGMSNSDFFQQPFDVRPVSTDDLPSTEAYEGPDIFVTADAMAFVDDLLERVDV